MKLSEKKAKTYMDVAKKFSEMSPDSQTKVGAIMISEDGRIIASSWNGFVRGADDESLPNTRPEKYEYIIHCEMNLLLNCAHEGIRTKGSTIFCTLSPCKSCLRACYQAGIKSIIFEKEYNTNGQIDYGNLKDLDVKKSKFYNYTKLDLNPKNKK